jgi:hypothetical protein
MFWLLGAYAPYILEYTFDIFQNVKKLKQKINQVLHVHKVVAQQINVYTIMWCATTNLAPNTTWPPHPYKWG